MHRCLSDIYFNSLEYMKLVHSGHQNEYSFRFVVLKQVHLVATRSERRRVLLSNETKFTAAKCAHLVRVLRFYSTQWKFILFRWRRTDDRAHDCQLLLLMLSLRLWWAFFPCTKLTPYLFVRQKLVCQTTSKRKWKKYTNVFVSDTPTQPTALTHGLRLTSKQTLLHTVKWKFLLCAQRVANAINNNVV